MEAQQPQYLIIKILFVSQSKQSITAKFWLVLREASIVCDRMFPPCFLES